MKNIFNCSPILILTAVFAVVVPVAVLASHLGGSSSFINVTGVSNPPGTININETVSIDNGYNDYYWGVYIIGHVTNSSGTRTEQNSGWRYHYGIGDSAGFTFQNLASSNYSTGGDAYLYWWNGANWQYWATLSVGGQSVFVDNLPATADIKANSSDGPVTVQNSTRAMLSWSVNDPSNVIQTCSVTPCDGSSADCSAESSAGLPTRVLASAQTYTLSCGTSMGGSAVDNVVINVSPPTVSVSLSANEDHVKPPKFIDLTASIVGGDATGDIRYQFDCFNDGVYDKDITTSATSYTWTNACKITTIGRNYFRVKITRQGATAENTEYVDAWNPPTVNIVANDSNGPIDIAYENSATLFWVSGMTTSCRLTSDGGNTWTSKSLNATESTGVLTASKTYQIACLNPVYTEVSDSVSVRVGSKILSLNSDKGVTSAMQPGIATISWDSRNAVSCSLTSDNTSVSTYTGTSGNRGINLSKTTNFTLTCNGDTSTPAQTSLKVQVVTIPSLTISCSGSPSTANTGDNVTWLADWTGGQAPYTYQWSGSGTESTNNVSVSRLISYASTGSKSESITVTSTDGQVVPKSCGSITISYPPLTGACKANKDTAFLNENVIWNAGSTSGGDGSYTYSWSGTNSLSCSGQPSSSCASVTKAYSSSGNKGAILTVTSAGSSVDFQCRNFSDSSGFVVVNTPAITGSCSADKTAATIGESVVWRANNIGGGDGSYTYSWSGTNSLSCSGQPSASCNSVSKTYSGSGDKSATLTVDSGGVSNNFPCVNSSGGSRVTVYEPTLTVNSSSNSVQVDGGTLQLQAMYDADGAGPKTATDVTSFVGWSSGNINRATVNNSNQKGLVTGESETGNVTITASHTDSYSNTISVNKTIDVTIRPTLSCSPATQSTLTNRTVNLTASGGNNTYTWTASGGTPDKCTSGCSNAFSTSYNSSGNKTVIVRSGQQSANCAVSVTAPTLSVVLSATPGQGNVPLADVILRADVTSNLSDSTNYTFWWNCDDPSTNVSYLRQASVCGEPTSPNIGAKFDGVNADYKEVNHTYSTVGTFKTKVVVERGAAPSAEKRVTVTVVIPPNSAPTATPLPPQAPSNYCANPFGWTLSWNYSDAEGNAQAAYQVIIKDASNGNVILDTARVNSSSTSYAIPLGYLSFGKTYTWTVTVTDNHQYTPLWSTATGSNFSTIAHAAPAVSFSWSPSSPSKDEQITFTDNTTVSGGAAKSLWNWDFSKASGVTLLTATNGSQVVAKFSTSGSKTIKLTVTDSYGLVCDKETGSGLSTLNVGRGIPKFREILPR